LDANLYIITAFDPVPAFPDFMQSLQFIDLKHRLMILFDEDAGS